MTVEISGSTTARKAFRAVLLASLALQSLPASNAIAQTAQSTTADGAAQQELEEVVVTAQFRAEKQQDIPIAITALSAEMLEARGQTTLTDVTASAPNVTLTSAGAGNGASATASIRGVGQYDFNFALEPGVGMYIDDVYYGVLFGSIFDLTDLDRVEILRGPQGILTGKNSIGGAVKLFSTRPDGVSGGYVEGTAGSSNRLDVRAAADFTLVPDTLFARVSGVSKRIDGYMTRLDYACATGTAIGPQQRSRDCELGQEGGRDIAAARVALRWLPSDTVENNLIIDATEDNSQVQPTKLIQQGPWAGTANYVTAPDSYTNYSTYTGHPATADAFTIPPVSAMSGWGVSNNLDIQLGENLAAKSITAYRQADGDFSLDIDASPADVETVYNVVSHRQFSQELRLSGTTQNDFLEWTVGLFYYDARQTIGGRKDIPGGIVPGGGLPPGVSLLDFIDDDTIDSDSKSGFAHVVLHPVEDLSVSVGARYTEESKDYSFTRITAGLPFSLGYPGLPFDLSPLNGVTGSYSGNKTDYRVSVDYRWSQDLMTYALASTGFKGGGVNPRPFTAEQVQPFGPETLNAYEIGLKSDFFQGRLRLNFAAFYNNYKDIQLTQLACPTAPCAQPANAGDADLKGAEVEATLRPIKGFTIDASASYLDFEYTALSANVAGVTNGMITPYTPEVKYSLGTQYEFPVGAAGSITPRVDWAYQSKMFTNPANAETNRIEGYGLLNARLTWRDAQDLWEVALSGTNLTNKFYYLNKFDSPAAPFFVVNGQPGRPREWAVTLKRMF